MPTLRTWNNALVATDMKGELSDAYAELYRAGVVERPYIVFDPMQPDGPSYDPLWWLQQAGEANLISSVWEIAQTIIPMTPEDKQPFWVESEQGLFAAALLHYYKCGASFSEASCLILGQSTSSLCAALNADGDIRIKILLGEIAEMKSETLASIDRGLRNKLMLFATDPNISHAFRGVREGAACFTWDNLKTHNIFLRIPADRLEQWGGAINLLYAQLIRYLERRPEKHSEGGKNNIQTLLLMDEFARFGKLEAIMPAISTLRSKSVNICLLVQSLAQLDGIYGEYNRRIMLDNCQYKAIFRADDADTQRYLADLIGTAICQRQSESEHMDRLRSTTGYSRGFGEHREWAVQPHELSALRDVLLLTPQGFSRADKLRPGSDLWEQMMFSPLAADSDQTKAVMHKSPAISVTNTKRNEAAKMISIEQRTNNATKRAASAEQAQRLAQRQAQDAQTAANRRRYYVVGELVCKYFPEVADFTPGTKGETAARFAPLEAFLAELASDRELVDELKEKSHQRTPRQTDTSAQNS